MQSTRLCRAFQANRSAPAGGSFTQDPPEGGLSVALTGANDQAAVRKPPPEGFAVSA